MHATHSPSFWRKARKPALLILILGAALLLVGTAASFWRDMGDTGPALVLYDVALADLPIVITERGNLESQVETTIRCEVENNSYDRSGNPGTQIIFIVPNGSAVREGDLLVELDSAAIRDRLDQQVLAYERARSQRIQGQARFDNQITQNETAEAQARLNLELAKLNYRMYTDPESGTFKLAMEDIQRQIDESRNAILEAQAALELEKTEKAGIEALFKLGYRGKSDLDQSRFDFMKAEDHLASAVNRLNNHEASQRQLETYEHEMQRLRLDGDVATAERNLKQVITDNESKLAQAEATKIEAERSEEKEKERLDKLEAQLELCKIYAPHDGMVVYARENSRYNSGTEIAEGVTVRQRQEILTLPDLSKMQVKTQIHEAVLDQVKPGLPVGVRIDAFPNRMYSGVVHEVAVVPTSSYFSNVKTYECTVRIVEQVEQLKPGMTAVAEIHVDRLRSVLAVPVQAVVQRDKETFCFVEKQTRVEKRPISLGRSNDKFVHVESGLQAGERLVLNPMAILNVQQSSETSIAPDADAGEAPEIPPEEIANAVERASKKSALVRSREGKQDGSRARPQDGSRPDRPRGGEAQAGQ